DVETGARRRVFQGDATYYAGSFSPDGASLLIQLVTVPSDQTLFVLDLATGKTRQLTEAAPPARYAHPAWSTDGRAVYCVTDRDHEFMMIGRLDVATGALEPVVAAEWDVGDFALSPDGQRLVYELNVDGYSEVHLLDLASGSDTVVEAPRGQVCDTG